MNEQKFQIIMQAVEHIELILQEVDGISQLPQPNKTLARIDTLVEEVLDDHQAKWRKKQVVPRLKVETTRLIAPVDANLFKKALFLVLKEVLQGISSAEELSITFREEQDSLALYFGNNEPSLHFGDPFACEFSNKPWCNSLFLNIAHKILLDHGGTLLLNTEGHSILPIVVRLPLSITVEDRMTATANR